MQRCHWCAPLRDEEVIRKREAEEAVQNGRNERKAGKGKGSGSSGETSVAQLQFFVSVIRRELDELRSRVTILEGAMQEP